MKSAKLKKVISKLILVLVLAVGFATIGLGTHGKLAAAACSVTPNASLGTDSMTVSVPTTATYNVWVRMLDPSTSNNSIYMQVDGGCAINVGGSSSVTANSWTWVNYQNGSTSSTISQSLTAGSHTILLTGNSADVGVDTILFLDSSCVPTGTGSNCTVSQPPTVSITSPTSGATVTGSSVSLAANAADTGTITSVVFKVDSTVVGTETSPSSGSSYGTTWNSTSVSNGSHTLSVTATDSANLSTTVSENFTVSNQTTPSCTSAPSAPTLSGSAAGTSGVNLSWTASTAATGCTLGNYIVYRGGTELAVVTPPSTTFNDSGLNPDTSYSYYVVASDGSSTNTTQFTADSNTVSVTTASVTTPPSAPTNVTDAAPSSTSVTLSWSASTDTAGGTVEGYKIYKGTGSDSLTYLTEVNSTAYTDNTVKVSTSNYYAVSAVDNYGNESTQTEAIPSPITTPSPPQTQPPTAPTNLQTTAITSSAISLSWTASTDSSGTVEGYYIYVNGSSTPVTVSGTTYTATGLTASTSYTFAIEAYNSAGQTSSASSITASTTSGTTSGSNGDINGDGFINYIDLSTLLKNWGQVCSSVSCGDLNGTTGEAVGSQDLQIMEQHWSSGLSNIVHWNTNYYNAVYTKPNNVCTNLGSTFPLYLGEYSGPTYDANTVEGWVSWDTKSLELTGVSFSGSAFGVGIQSNYQLNSSTDGYLTFVRGTTNNNYLYDQYIGVLYFKSLTTGNTSIYMHWHGTGIGYEQAGIDNDLAPTPYGSKIVVGNPVSCSSSNNAGGGTLIPYPGTSSNINPSKSTNTVTQSTATTTANTLPATKAASATVTNAAVVDVTPSSTTTLLPVANNSTWQLSTSATLTPASAPTGTYSSVSYYLNGSLLSTVTGANLGYVLNPSSYANGSYTLTAKEILSTGIQKTITTNLNIKNAASFNQFYLQSKEYLWIIIAIVFIAAILLVSTYSKKALSMKHGSNWSQASVDPDVREHSHKTPPRQ